MTGCDISAAQGQIDFDALAPHISFVFSKLSEGVGFEDPQFKRNWSESRRVGLQRGAYHYARPDLNNTAQDEARWFLANLGPLDDGDMLALDYEVQWDGDVVAWCRSWLDFVRGSTGVAPFLYLSLYEASVYAWPSDLKNLFPLWLADYDGNPNAMPWTPWPKVTIKQWTSGGTAPGITGQLDLDTDLEDAMTDDQLWAALQRVYPGKLEELVKPTVRVMIEKDQETQAAISGQAKAAIVAALK